jgi:hypothetical protein
VGGRQHNFNHLVLEGSGTTGETNVGVAGRERSEYDRAKVWMHLAPFTMVKFNI